MTTALNFDARNIDPSQAVEPIPAAWYTMQITGSEMKPNSQNTGSYLELELTVVSGPYVNRKIFERLNLVNPNPAAVEIANKDLSAICHATDRLVIQSSEQLHMIPMDVKVKVKAAEGDYDASNEIRGYAKAGTKATAQAGSAGAAPAMAGMQTPPAAPAAPAAMQPPVAAPVAAPMPANPVQAPAAPAPTAQAAPVAAPVAPTAQPEAVPAPVVHQEAAPAPAAPVAPQAAPQAAPQSVPWGTPAQ